MSSYLGTFRLVLRDATIAGHLASNPLERPLPRRRTKRSLSASNKRVTFVPLLADELEALVEVLRDPQDSAESIYFPLTEFLVLTGLRWGEGVALDRDRVSWAGGLIVIDKAMERGLSESSPTKTGATRTIPLRRPLARLVSAQQARTHPSAPGRIFPGPSGPVLSYGSWRKIGWQRAIERAEVAPREGDAQKALRRTYVASSLMSGRSPKLVGAEVGHTSIRMVMEVYDAFVDPSCWPNESERRKLTKVYGWELTDHDGRVIWTPDKATSERPERPLQLL